MLKPGNVNGTTWNQHKMLLGTSRARMQRVSPFNNAAQSMTSKEFDFRVVFSGLSDAAEVSTSGVFPLHRETKFIICFDFAVALPSPASSCFLSDITSEEFAELKQLMLNKH